MANLQSKATGVDPPRHGADSESTALHDGKTTPPEGAEALVERLAAHGTLGSAPRAELQWLAAHGRLERHQPGAVVSSPDIPVPGMYVIFSGRISIHLLHGGVRHKVAEWHGGDVTGLLPYSRLVNAPGDTVVDEPTELLLVPRDSLRDLARECHEVTSLLVHVMLDRARFFTTTLLHDEKLKSLGRLAAGLAHELNNPAAAITRFAKMLPAALDDAEAASRALAGAGLGVPELAAIRTLSVECHASQDRHVRSPIEEAEREQAIEAWLDARGIDAIAADAIAQSPVTMTALERLDGSVPAAALAGALRWVSADCSVRALAAEIEQAGTRISDLVTAVRGFSRVDESAVPQPVDVGKGLGQALAVLKGKARDKGVRVSVAVEDGLPPVRGMAAELNQVWANLIDNALDAAPAGGNVSVEAAQRSHAVTVRVADDGAGIPDGIRDRIFDPFFTTKDVGKGTGLGLDIVRRLVERHDGDIEVSSEPGRTEFTVTIPMANPQPQHGSHDQTGDSGR
jgi:signal transduction histidine kinase